MRFQERALQPHVHEPHFFLSSRNPLDIVKLRGPDLPFLEADRGGSGTPEGDLMAAQSRRAFSAGTLRGISFEYRIHSITVTRLGFLPG